MTSKDTNPKDMAASNKIPLTLLSPIACAKWAVAQFSGLLKYGAWNWRAAGVRSSVYLDAARRHLDAYASGEAVDPIDGTDHRANVMACMAILIDAEAAGKLTDDRPPSVDLRPAYAEVEALMVRLREQYKDKTPRHYTIADTESASFSGFVKARAAAREEPIKVGDRVRICRPGYTEEWIEGTVVDWDDAARLVRDASDSICCADVGCCGTTKVELISKGEPKAAP